jgi:hypothetical protein
LILALLSGKAAGTLKGLLTCKSGGPDPGYKNHGPGIFIFKNQEMNLKKKCSNLFQHLLLEHKK